MRAAIYTRVSTDEQAKEGLSLEFQESDCRAYATRSKWTVTQIYSDPGFSGALESRPMLDQLMRDAKEHRFDAVITWKFDRLFRIVEYQKRARRELAELGIIWKSATEDIDIYTTSGNLQHSIHATFAEWERDIIRERFHHGKIQKARHGRQPSHWSPYGYRIITKAEALSQPEFFGRDGEYVFVPDEVESASLMFGLYLEGKSLSDVCRALEERNIRPRRSKGWRPVCVRQILMNPVYMGTAYANRIVRRPKRDSLTGKVTQETLFRPEEEWVRIPCPAIVSEEEFSRVQRLLEENRARKSGRPDRLYPLSGLIKCACCERNYTGKYTNGRRTYSKPGRRYPREADLCRNRSWSAEELERGILKYLSEIAENPDLIRQAIECFAQKDSNLDVGQERRRLEEDLGRIERQLRALIEQELEDPDLASIHADLKAEKKQQRKDLLDRLDGIEMKEGPLATVAFTTIEEVCNELSKRLVGITDEAVMRKVFLSLVHSCEASEDGTHVVVRLYSEKLFTPYPP
jgi:site-specific DNA recombinase